MVPEIRRSGAAGAQSRVGGATPHAPHAECSRPHEARMSPRTPSDRGVVARALGDTALPAPPAPAHAHPGALARHSALVCLAAASSLVTLSLTSPPTESVCSETDGAEADEKQ